MNFINLNNCPICNNELIFDNRTSVICTNEFKSEYSIIVSHYLISLYNFGNDKKFVSEHFYLYNNYCIVRRECETTIYFYNGSYWNNIFNIKEVLPFYKFNTLNNFNKLLLLI